MQEARNARAQAYRRHRRQKRIWRNVLSVMACVVVFCTTYALILPAITMEKEAFCGIEAHTHKDDCYAQKVVTVCDPAGGTELPVIHAHDEFCYDGETLICTLPELAGHVHTDACYTQVTYEAHAHGEECYTPVRGTLLCEVPEEEGHAHSDACYVPGETLLCTETEREGHTHGDVCYSVSSELTCGTEECEGHTHGDSCYDCQTKLTCKTAETEGHTHSDSCYVSKAQLACDKEETKGHTHGDSCYTEKEKLTCDKAESEGHAHGADCYDADGNLICDKTESEGHSHGSGCYTKEKKLTCDKKEKAAHSHDAGCYIEAQSLGCGLEEVPAHTHGADCYTEEKTLKCETPEKPSHAHSAECYTEKKTLICEVAEDPGHAHSGSCYEQVLGCGKEEKEGHAHSDECYEMVPALSCGKEEREETVVQTVLECTLEQIAPHVHNESCTDCTITNATVHQHTAECISKTEEALVCELNEHEHTLACFSNPNADVETKADWDAMIANLELTGDWAEDVLIIAKSQLGYNESTKNYIVLEDGETMKGYTRYGAWYGGPYGDWCAMYVSFCLDYAGVEVFPQDCNCNNWVQTLIQRNRFRSAGQYEPQSADLIFFDPNQDGVSTHVGLVVEVDGNEVKTIEGNTSDTVAYRTYKLTDPDILGYGLLPRKLSAEDQAAVDAVIALIDAMPSADEIDAKVEEFAEAEDEDGEIAYLEEVYQQVYDVYTVYCALGEELQPYVTNRDKLLELEYIWSMATFAQVNVWLDGTCGGIESLDGASNVRVSHNDTNGFKLPTTQEWLAANRKVPQRYDFVLRGWYDIINHKYYYAGETATFKGNTIFYADWVARTYDIGQYEAGQMAPTVSTNHFVTTRMFDYSAIFNMYSVRHNITNKANIGSGSHSETWSEVAKNSNVGYKGMTALNFVLRDWDDENKHITYPANRTEATDFHDNNNNNYVNGIVRNLYSEAVISKLFSTANSKDPSSSSFVLGQEYLGKADHLLQYGSDPNNEEEYGYYFYDSQDNAASYNKSDQRFYVYKYLERTTDAEDGDSNDVGRFSDFLPLNSHHANTNGQTVRRYSHNGTNNYAFNSKSLDEDKERVGAGTNLWFGMQMDIEFYLPNKPNTTINGVYGNKGINGKDMVFEFSGDDDVWVLIGDGINEDGSLQNPQLVLDIGGIHRIASGTIDFATGEVRIAGRLDNTFTNVIRSLNSGTHYLRMYYLERGDSQSNLAIRFNITPRYLLNLEKVDYDNREMLLDGAKFAVYTDLACTQPAELWTSKAAYENGQANTNEFTITNGEGSIWGMAAGHTYYIKEIAAPPGYDIPEGIIKLAFDHLGDTTYEVLSMEGEPSTGFSAYGFSIDPETEQAYMIVTNGRNVVPINVEVTKQWAEGSVDIPESVTVQLMDGSNPVGDPVTLTEQNQWKHTWENLPQSRDNGEHIVYTVVENLVPGYTGAVTGGLKTDDSGDFAYVITNTPVPVTSVTVNKLWLDKYGNEIDGAHDNTSLISNQEITIKLLADNVDTGQQVVLSQLNNWTATFGGLPVDKDGVEIVYTVEEVLDTDKWAPSYEANGTDNVTITNRQKMWIPVEKIWDGSIAQNEREDITLHLYAVGPNESTGTSVATLTLSAENDWKGKFLVVDPEEGTQYYVYEPTEKFMPAYSNQSILVINGSACAVSKVDFDGATGEAVTITVTNYAIYDLPNTGGPGTILYTTGGMLLMAAAILLLSHKQKKTRRKERSF